MAALVDVVGEAHVLVGQNATERYGVDCTGRYRGEPLAVVRPAETAEVAGVLRLCAEAGVSVVPQGGNTGLVGGGVPRGGELVLSLERLAELGDVEPFDAQVAVDAGVTLAALQRHAGHAGLAFPVDLGARDSATVGGLVSTNAGGVHVVRYGSMRAHVVGLEAVLATGDVIDRMTGLHKDNAGYDLVALLVGSEGTLAVITRAKLQLVPRYDHRVTVLVGIEGTAAALEVLRRLLESVSALEAAEIFYGDGMELVRRHVGLRAPFIAPAYLLLEAAAHRDPTSELAAALASLPDVLDTALAVDASDRERLWRLREAHIEAVGREGAPVVRFDVAVSRARLPEFERRAREVAAAMAPCARCVVYGHLGDGNLHVNVVGEVENEEGLHESFLELVLDLSGTVSAEHGIGIEKVHLLARSRSNAELAAMHTIKRALDPNGILNPGVVLTPARRP